MPISFATVDLLLEDPQGAVRDWLDQHLSELYASIFCLDNTAVRESRYVGITNTGSPLTASSSAGWPSYDTPTVRRVGLPIGNYPRPPKPRINSLYWPSGATRWAQGLFLITKTNLDTILAALGGAQAGLFSLTGPTVATSTRTSSGSSSGTSGFTSSGLQTSLWMLPPRPISAPGVLDVDRLWLLPLVDARYLWQFYHVGQYTPSTWGDALNAITGLSNTDTPAMGDAVNSAYGRPSATEFVRDFENAALLTDAIALTLQRRIVGGIATDAYYRFKNYTAQTSTAALTTASNNLNNCANGNWPVVAGGDFTTQANQCGNFPDGIVITFGNRSGDRVAAWSKYDATISPTNGGSKVFHCSTPAVSSPDSNGKIVRGFEWSLAQQVGDDYFRWFSLAYDITCAGIVPWQPTGFDDYVRWEISVRGKGRRRKYQCQTRAVSMPPNFGSESLPLDPGGSSSSSSSGSSSSSSSVSSRSSTSQSSGSSRSGSGSNSLGSGSGSSQSSTDACQCGTATFTSNGRIWQLTSNGCAGGTPVSPTSDAVAAGAGATVTTCCSCSSSSSGSSSSKASSGSSQSSNSQSSQSNQSSGDSGGSSGNSGTSSGTSSQTGSSSASGGSSGSSGSGSSGSTSGSGSNSGTSGSGSGTSGSGDGGSSGNSDTSSGSGTSGSGSGSGTSGSGSGNTSGSGSGTGSSGNGSGTGSGSSNGGGLSVTTQEICYVSC